MALLSPNEGELVLLGIALNNVANENQTLKLFTNDYTPVEGSEAANFTEASGNGYAAKTLTKGSWTVAADGDTVSAIYAQQTFTFTGADDSIYGYYIVGATSAKVLWAERFSSEEPVYDGKIIKITPYIALT